MRRTVYSGSRKKAHGGREDDRLRQVPASEPPQTDKRILQIVVVDIGCRSIESIRRAGREVVDCFRALAPGFANGRGRSMERPRRLISRFVQLPAGRPAQFLH
jgi:hypothetical protein